MKHSIGNVSTSYIIRLILNDLAQNLEYPLWRS